MMLLCEIFFIIMHNAEYKTTNDFYHFVVNYNFYDSLI